MTERREKKTRAERKFQHITYMCVCIELKSSITKERNSDEEENREAFFVVFVENQRPH